MKETEAGRPRNLRRTAIDNAIVRSILPIWMKPIVPRYR
jgi:hypothetical protein